MCILHQPARRAPSPEGKRRDHPAADHDPDEEARSRLADCLEADLAAQLRALPPHGRSAIEAVTPNDGVFDGLNHSLRRRMVAGWQRWLDADAAMPGLIRALVRADEPRLNRLIENAGLVHIASLAAGLTSERRLRLLAGLGEDYSARVTTYLSDPPEPQPRRELLKARLHEMLSRAEAGSARAVPRELGLDAVASLLAAFSADRREHVQRAWPPAVYNEMTTRRTDPEPHWRLAEATWKKLME